MTLTGPQKIPFAVTSGPSWYQDTYLGSPMEVNVGVIHTTEGTSLPSYDGGANAPNITGVPNLATKTIKWYQHFDVDRSSRALVNASGGVQTNTANCFQIELVGTCDQATYLRWQNAGTWAVYWPGAPDWALAEVAKLVRWLHDNHDLKIQSSVTWKAYPGSYGASNGVRLSFSQWGEYYGWLGHQHVPENYHGDPGAINWKRIEELAIGEVNVALTTADVSKILKTDGLAKSPDYLLDTETNKFWTIESYLYEGYRTARDGAADAAAAKAAVAGVGKQVADLSKKVDALSTGGVDLDALAAKVADLLAARLAD